MIVVRTAKRISEMESLRAGPWAGDAVSKGNVRAGELLREDEWRLGRHLRTASTEARHG